MERLCENGKTFGHDYRSHSVQLEFAGYSPSVTADDRFVFYLAASAPIVDKEDVVPGRFLRKLSLGQPAASPLAEVLLYKEWVYEVTEVVAHSEKLFAFRVYDEHEYRYYTVRNNKRGPFCYPASSDSETHKEQYNLVFASDGSAAAFAERNWNELTRIVYVDLVRRKRTTLPVYGSFPAIRGGIVYFLSDPSFVSASDGAECRQIKRYALYGYDVTSGTLRIVHQADAGVELSIL